jgi:hypothetical protein
VCLESFCMYRASQSCIYCGDLEADPHSLYQLLDGAGFTKYNGLSG